MANIKSSLKDVKSSLKNREINKKLLSAAKTLAKKAVKTTLSEDIKATYSKIDQLVAKNLYSRNKAAREKSKIAKAVNKAKVSGVVHTNDAATPVKKATKPAAKKVVTKKVTAKKTKK